MFSTTTCSMGLPFGSGRLENDSGALDARPRIRPGATVAAPPMAAALAAVDRKRRRENDRVIRRLVPRPLVRLLQKTAPTPRERLLFAREHRRVPSVYPCQPSSRWQVSVLEAKAQSALSRRSFL